MGGEVCVCHGNSLQAHISHQEFLPDDLVFIVDGVLGHAEVVALRSEMRLRFADINPRFLILDNGRRRSIRVEEGDSVRLDLNHMSRVSFLRALAAVVGRLSIEPQVIERDDYQSDVSAAMAAERKKRKILVVEDNPINRDVLSRQMQILGYSVDMANDGIQALERWRRGGYEMILTDCHMPELDGYGLSEQIRREESEAVRIPIVAITADALKGTEQRCLASGMDDYLTKPVQLKMLAPMLEKWLALPVEDEAVSQSTRVDVSNAVVDENFLSQLMGVDDVEILNTIYEDFLRSGREIIDEISVEMAARNAPNVGVMSHKLKSSARTVGANAMADCCERLEQAGKQADWEVIDRDGAALLLHFNAVEQWVMSDRFTETAVAKLD